jgi:uncharacterized metal-binding protein YceD (DUF177 family)
MSDTTALRVADLPQNSPAAFDLHPDSAALKALAAQLGLTAVRKLRFTGTIAAQGTHDWVLKARLGATVVQPCVVTLEPVTTRIDMDVQRLYLSDWTEPETPEVEMSADDTVEPLRAKIDPGQVMAESLTLALPLYPRKGNADLGEAVFTEPGHKPMRDEDARPFAGLAQLREQLDGDD